MREKVRPHLAALEVWPNWATTRADSARCASYTHIHAHTNDWAWQLRTNPLLLQVHARALLSELASRAAAAMVAGGGDSAAVPAEPTLDDVPDSFFSRTQRDGYDAVYLLGVWATGEAGIAMSQRHLEELGAAASLESKDIIVSSPFAVVGYEVAEVLGGEAALSGFRRRLADHGIALILDFGTLRALQSTSSATRSRVGSHRRMSPVTVPNHVAVDHPWVKDRPEFLMQGNAEMLAKEPQNYIEVAGRVVRRGSRSGLHGRSGGMFTPVVWPVRAREGPVLRRLARHDSAQLRQLRAA